MQNALAILGAGDFAREVYWHYLSDHPEQKMVFVDEYIHQNHIICLDKKVPIIKNWNFNNIIIDGIEVEITNFIIGIGTCTSKLKIVEKALAHNLKPIDTFVHSKATITGLDNSLGKGGIITPGCQLTCNISLGDYVVLNLNTTVGHDTIIEDYCTCNPGVNLSGKVHLKKSSELGTGVVVRQKTIIAEKTIIGAQSCIVKDITEPGGTWVGVPAKKLR